MTRIRAVQPVTRLLLILAIALAMSGIAIALAPTASHHDAVNGASRISRTLFAELRC